MNEFEWRRQLRDLNRPATPPRDLWNRIDAALETLPQNTAPATVQLPRKNHRRVWALAASVAAIVVLASSVALRMHMTQPVTQPFADATHIVTAPWKPADPRLAGAAIELDAARMELQQAMQQAPDSPALQRLLQRTDQQQSRLRQFEKQSG